MNKTLKIEGNGRLIVSSFKTVSINSKDLNEMIYENLPALEPYKSYPATISIIVNIHDDNLNITTEGYSKEQEKEENTNEAI